MKLVIRSIMVPLALAGSGCGPSNEEVVAACEAAVDAENDLPCLLPAEFKNAKAECEVFADRGRIAADRSQPGGVRQCATDLTCGNAELIAYFECRADSVFCDDNDQPAVPASCDDHLPSASTRVDVR